MKLELRPKQVATIESVSAAFREGYRRVMVCAPCGFGKTEVATAMMQAAHANGKRGSFLADRISLITQTSERFDKYELPHGIMQADHWRDRPYEQIQICSVQTLRRRRWPDSQLIMIDEAHELGADVRKKLEAKDCYAVGLSATPVTKALGKYFDVVINAATTNELIDLGLLVGLNVHSYRQPDLTGVTLNTRGEWEEKETEKRVMQVVGDVVQKYIADGQDEKFIAFAWNINHANELCREFIAAGINTATYTADDQPEDRHECVRDFKSDGGALRGLISVKALTRGFDVTSVRLLIDAHPFRKAWWDYVQMLGRVMRAHPGKTTARVFDHSGNYLHFWQPVNDLFANGVRELDDGKPKPKKTKPDAVEPKPLTCPKCALIHRRMPFCPKCGFEYPRTATVQHVPGTLKELVATGDQGLMRKTLWPQVCWYVKHKRSPRDDIHAQKMAQAIYAEITGSIAHARFENTKPEECSSEVLSKIRGNQQRWVIAKRAVQAKKSQGVPA